VRLTRTWDSRPRPRTTVKAKDLGHLTQGTKAKAMDLDFCLKDQDQGLKAKAKGLGYKAKARPRGIKAMDLDFGLKDQGQGLTSLLVVL